MAELALQGGRKLQEDTAAIDLARDAHKLRWGSDSGGGRLYMVGSLPHVCVCVCVCVCVQVPL